ncbi:Type IV secretion system protein VirB11 [Pseudolycoriella hygida]|uniref:Type IV secretion system protein VirB11 n=1 Tax=Pseudolycoriella hygida TaxID=35572 RepID=A0A9Q0N927_9DIPT|nr:Type IV secretion system protein VirB11 [Pseudolycoriella hygida]
MLITAIMFTGCVLLNHGFPQEIKGLSILLSLSILLLIFLQKKELVLIRVDNHTGEAEILSRLTEKEITKDEAIDKFFTARYLMLREQYNYFPLRHDYELVQIYSNVQVKQDYLLLYEQENSPDKLLGEDAILAEIVPKSSKYDSRIQNIAYNSDNVTKINAKLGFITTIVFSDDEIIEKAIAGFSLGWKITAYNNKLFITPVPVSALEKDGEDDLAGNNTVENGAKIAPISKDHDNGGKHPLPAYMVNYSYPEQEKCVQEQQYINDKLRTRQDPKNWHYFAKIGKDSENILPNFAYDDGAMIYLGFSSIKNLPSVFLFNNGQEQTTNYSIKQQGNFKILVIHRLSERLILRYGKQIVGRLGEAGIDGHIDSHFLQRFGGSLMLSVVQDVMKGISQRKSSSSNVVNAYQADHSKDALVAMAEKTLDNAINIPPTMYKKQGEIIGILYINYGQKMSDLNISLHNFAQALFFPLWVNELITEIAINRPGEIWYEVQGAWTKEENLKITNQLIKSFTIALASFNNSWVNEANPILSASLQTGERVQIVMAPATETRPSLQVLKHESYIEQGFYQKIINDKNDHRADKELMELFTAKKIAEFMELAVFLGKTIVVAGATGSGKTSYMKTLTQQKLNLLNIKIGSVEFKPYEKVYTLSRKDSQNYVHLFYPSESSSDPRAIVTSSSLLKACFRMKPSRILLSEVRGGETWDFLKIVHSGHGGSITSIHAGSIDEAIHGLITRCFQHKECRNLSYQVIKEMVLSSIDIICHINCGSGARYLNEIYFKAVSQQQMIREIIIAPYVPQSIKQQAYQALIIGFTISCVLPLTSLIIVNLPEKASLHGNAKFASKPDIQNSASVTLDNQQAGGIIVGKYKGKLIHYIKPDFVSLGAGTRSGKGASVIIPNLLTWQDSLIVLDIKQECFAITSKYRQQVLKQEVFLFNPFSYQSHKFNPLAYVDLATPEGSSDLLSIAEIIYPTDNIAGAERHFNHLAQSLFIALSKTLWLVIHHKQIFLQEHELENNFTTSNLLALYQQVAMSEIKDLLETTLALKQLTNAVSEIAIDALNKINSFILLTGESKASVISAFEKQLKLFPLPVVKRATRAIALTSKI